MQDLVAMPLACGVHTRISRSALPESPTVPDRPPGRLRLRTAATLRRLAGRLDGRRVQQPEYRWSDA
jgi:hypothetical protein